MSVDPSLEYTLPASGSLYRITSLSRYSLSIAQQRKIVNGQGSRLSAHRGRYNYPGVTSVYIAESPEVPIAEQLFYFHKATLTALDLHRMWNLPAPPTIKRFLIWEISFKNDIRGILDLTKAGASGSLLIYRACMASPYQDYYHLCQKRAEA